MPWTRVKCPDAQEHTFDDCIACDHPCCDIEIREALFAHNSNQDPTHVGTSISVTSLIGCLRSTYLERVTDYAAPPMSQWYSLRGELIHKLVEHPDRDDPDTLRRSEMSCLSLFKTGTDEIPISGRIDSYKLKFLKHGTLKDWKSIGDNGMQFIVYEGAKEDHIWQTNIYAWLLRRNGFRVDHIEIAYLSLMAIVKTGQEILWHEYLAAAPSKTGKRKRMVSIPTLVKEYPSGRKKWACVYRVPEVPIYDTETIEDFMRPRILMLNNAFKHGTMPDMADEETRAWKCNEYCHVKDQCDEFQGEINVEDS